MYKQQKITNSIKICWQSNANKNSWNTKSTNKSNQYIKIIVNCVLTTKAKNTKDNKNNKNKTIRYEVLTLKNSYYC